MQDRRFWSYEIEIGIREKMLNQNSFIPLAERLRPKRLDEYCGQQHILAKDTPLYQAIIRGQLHSMILWGPPGVGKTTLARLIASYVNAEFVTLSAVTSGVKDIREIMTAAQERLISSQVRTILFVDEVHRFNKSQQDAFLPYIENGTVVFIGATTENPSFELNNALISRARVYILQSLSEEELGQLIDRAIQLMDTNITFKGDARKSLIRASDGDGRRCLNFLELLLQLATDNRIDDNCITQVLTDGYRRFDKGGDLFYDQISALHKSVRGSDPDAALYWFARMIDGGCDPHYIARRVVRMSIEDIGIADPRAHQMALSAWDTYARLGSPEGELAIAQAIVYCAVAAKSNAVYKAYKLALASAKDSGSLSVPLHLRNAPTSLMKSLGFGKDYRYAHDEKDAYAAGVKYFPDEMQEQRYYQPTEFGLEIKIKEKLLRLKQLHKSMRDKTDF